MTAPMIETLRRHRDSVTRSHSFAAGLAIAFVLFASVVW
jgi:hypothetical protein